MVKAVSISTKRGTDAMWCLAAITRTRKVQARSPDPDNRKQVIYQLTEKGRDLTPVLVELIRWGGQYDPNTPVPGSFVKRHKRDNDALLNEVRAAMMEAANTMAQKTRNR